MQTALKENPFSGQVFVFRGRRGDLIKVLWFDGDGLCLFAKRLKRGRFIWPQATSGPPLNIDRSIRIALPKTLGVEEPHQELLVFLALCSERSKAGTD